MVSDTYRQPAGTHMASPMFIPVDRNRDTEGEL